MSVIKKAPAILMREFRMEEPVSVLLRDYRQFVASSPDQVINSASRERRKNAVADAANRGATEGPAKP